MRTELLLKIHSDFNQSKEHERSSLLLGRALKRYWGSPYLVLFNACEHGFFKALTNYSETEYFTSRIGILINLGSGVLLDDLVGILR